MDRFLQARELLDSVCFELSYDAGSLHSLLLTSRLFVEAALDVLWSDIEFERPFVACLPQDAFKEEKVSRRLSYTYILVRSECMPSNRRSTLIFLDSECPQAAADRARPPTVPDLLRSPHPHNQGWWRVPEVQTYA